MISNIKIIDTHCHIEQSEFDEDRDEVITRAQNFGVHIITSAIYPESWRKATEISKKYGNVSLSIGLDPAQYQLYQDAINWISDNKPPIIAIGEVGLDHFYIRDHTEREKQEQAFIAFITLAKDLKIPIQIHSRSAGRRALETLERQAATEVHMHAFDGKASLARVASKDLGYYFSIPTSVVRSPQKRKLVKAVEIERLLFETDSPVLGPERTERNEPGNVETVLKETAAILQREKEELREIVLENTFRLYRQLR